MAAKSYLETDLSGNYNEVADFFASSPSAQRIADYRLSDSAISGELHGGHANSLSATSPGCVSPSTNGYEAD
jgi:hypothetical protein